MWKKSPVEWHLEDCGGDNFCWLWDGPISKGGYPRVSVDGVRCWAHRYVYQQMVGSIPEDHNLHHTCNVSRCINPFHLVPMLQADHWRHHKEQPGYEEKRVQAIRNNFCRSQEEERYA